MIESLAAALDDAFSDPLDCSPRYHPPLAVGQERLGYMACPWIVVRVDADADACWMRIANGSTAVAHPIRSAWRMPVSEE